MKRLLLTASLALLCTGAAQGQRRDKAVYKTPEPGYYQNNIQPAIKSFEQKPAKTRRAFKLDYAGMKPPNDLKLYTQVWHTPPVSQGNTNTCWCFSTTSFYESEVKRLSGKEVRLSPMYTVYWEYVERARLWVKTRGGIDIGEGSETNAVARMMDMYGIVPADQYTCMRPGEQFYNHAPLFKEIDTYFKHVKETGAWNEEQVMATTQSILDFHLGRPPKSVTVGGRTMTPQQYLREELRLVPDDYVNFMSLMEKPFMQKAEYEVPDNWWHSEEYYNAPVDLFMKGVKSAVRSGYSLAIGGDFSEPGIDRETQCIVVPTFDIPGANIDDAARQFRFANGTTTDDHAVHLVGVHTAADGDWFLIKDSGSGSRDGAHSGYFFMHEDFVKLKIMSYTVHKDAVQSILQQFAGR